jgi:hypothetical protein
VKQIQTNLLYILTKIKSEKSTFVFKSLVYFWSGLPAFTQEVKRVMGVVHGQNIIQWKSSQPLSLLLNFIQYFEQPGPGRMSYI